ncbi:hypothetical protein L0A91_13180 [Ornithinimicrobium sp. INDO-MA30-4]|nr:hypothetical protein [Ornithinimicrobium sp. INDO-MA30-4]UJH70136.1 hypothetical protein L0A91_13180 [Ornithinimicrobium sp. INDO-MA30-4]
MQTTPRHAPVLAARLGAAAARSEVAISNSLTVGIGSDNEAICNVESSTAQFTEVGALASG